MIECIVQNARDAKDAEKLGVTRLELVSAIELGGLTRLMEPSKVSLTVFKSPCR